MKNISLYIARRYFFSRQIKGIIHVISLISMLAILVGTTALICILSTFNGFENTVSKLYSIFESDIKITPVKGKFFHLDATQLKQLREMPSLSGVSPIIEDNAAIYYGDVQYIATCKGMEPAFLHSNGLDTMIFEGDRTLMKAGVPLAVLGAGVASNLSQTSLDANVPLQIYMPSKDADLTMAITNLTELLRSEDIRIGGLFTVQQDYDSKYILLPLDNLRKLTEQAEDYTAVELNLIDKSKLLQTKLLVQNIVGAEYKVQDRYQQQPLLYKLMRNEKFVVYLILSFVLLIASFNLIGALLMVATDKKKDMAVLLSMGLTQAKLNKVILWQGLMLSIGGGVLGMLLGAIIVWLQMQYGFVKLSSNSTFVIQAYPVAMKWIDFIQVFLTIVGIGLLTAWLPAKTISKQININLIRDRG